MGDQVTHCFACIQIPSVRKYAVCAKETPAGDAAMFTIPWCTASSDIAIFNLIQESEN
jgi:hypothetical protein